METPLALSCIYSNKDKNFKANHNGLRIIHPKPFVVSIVTKIRILKQITTHSVQNLCKDVLYL